MIFDPNYQRGDIDSAELVNRMNNWSGLPWTKKVIMYNYFIFLYQDENEFTSEQDLQDNEDSDTN